MNLLLLLAIVVYPVLDTVVLFEPPIPSPSLSIGITNDAYCFSSGNDLCVTITQEHECLSPCWWVVRMELTHLFDISTGTPDTTTMDVGLSGTPSTVLGLSSA